MKIPNKQDWCVNDLDYDGQYAFKKFYGKTASQAKAMYREEVVSRVEDLQSMPSIPFQYYFISFLEFISEGDFGYFKPNKAIAAQGLLFLVVDKIKNKPNEINQIWDRVEPLVNQIMAAPEKYDVEDYDFEEISILVHKLSDN